MTDNEKLIESVRDWPTITRMSHSTQLEKLVELRDALEAAEKAHTPTDDEREALIDVMVMTKLSDFAATDMSTIHQAVDAILKSDVWRFRRIEVPEPSAEAAALVDAVMGAMDRWSVNANLDGDDEPGLWVPRVRVEAAIDSVPLPFVAEPQGEPYDAQEAVRRLRDSGVGAYMILAAVTKVYDMETKP